MKKKRTFLGKAPDMTQFSELGRIIDKGLTWVVFHKKGKDWQNLKVVLLNGRRVKANFVLAWSIFRQDFSDCHDLTIMRDHDYELYGKLHELAAQKFPVV